MKFQHILKSKVPCFIAFIKNFDVFIWISCIHVQSYVLESLYSWVTSFQYCFFFLYLPYISIKPVILICFVIPSMIEKRTPLTW